MVDFFAVALVVRSTVCDPLALEMTLRGVLGTSSSSSCAAKHLRCDAYKEEKAGQTFTTPCQPPHHQPSNAREGDDRGDPDAWGWGSNLLLVRVAATRPPVHVSKLLELSQLEINVLREVGKGLAAQRRACQGKGGWRAEWVERPLT